MTISRRVMRIFLPLGVGTHRMSSWGLWSNRWWCLGVWSVVFWLQVLELIAIAVDEENYGAHYLDTVIGYHDHLHHAWNAFRQVEAENYRAHHLDTIVGYPDHLVRAWDAFRHVNAKKLRSASRRLRHRSSWPRRPHVECIRTPRCKILRSTPRIVRHRLLRRPRPRMECIPTPRCKKLGSDHLDSVIGYHLWRKWTIRLYACNSPMSP